MQLILSVVPLNLRISLFPLLTEIADIFSAGLLIHWKRNHPSVLGNVESEKKSRKKDPWSFIFLLSKSSKMLLTFPIASSSADLKVAKNQTQLRSIYLCVNFHFTDIGGIYVADCNWSVLVRYVQVHALQGILIPIQPWNVSCIQLSKGLFS